MITVLAGVRSHLCSSVDETTYGMPTSWATVGGVASLHSGRD